MLIIPEDINAMPYYVFIGTNIIVENPQDYER